MVGKWLKIFKRNDNNIDLEIIKQAIIDYRIEGKILMRKLAKKYNLNINDENDYNKLITRSNKEIPRRGQLSKRWNYAFHGSECGFYNRKHHQQVEVVLNNHPNFEHIEPWFLLSYMKSTDKYKTKIVGLDWQQLKPIIENLYKSGDI